MSVHHLSAVADLSDLPPTCKLVLYGLAVDADARGRVTTSNATMRQRTGLSERAVRGTIAALEKLDRLARVPSTIRHDTAITVQLQLAS